MIVLGVLVTGQRAAYFQGQRLCQRWCCHQNRGRGEGEADADATERCWGELWIVRFLLDSSLSRPCGLLSPLLVDLFVKIHVTVIFLAGVKVKRLQTGWLSIHLSVSNPVLLLFYLDNVEVCLHVHSLLSSVSLFLFCILSHYFCSAYTLCRDVLLHWTSITDQGIA